MKEATKAPATAKPAATTKPSSSPPKTQAPATIAKPATNVSQVKPAATTSKEAPKQMSTSSPASKLCKSQNFSESQEYSKDPALAKKQKEVEEMQKKLGEAKHRNAELQNDMKRIDQGKGLLERVANLEITMRDKNNELTMKLEEKKAEYLKLKEEVDE